MYNFPNGSANCPQYQNAPVQYTRQPSGPAQSHYPPNPLTTPQGHQYRPTGVNPNQAPQPYHKYPGHHGHHKHHGRYNKPYQSEYNPGCNTGCNVGCNVSCNIPQIYADVSGPSFQTSYCPPNINIGCRETKPCYQSCQPACNTFGTNFNWPNMNFGCGSQPVARQEPVVYRRDNRPVHHDGPRQVRHHHKKPCHKSCN